MLSIMTLVIVSPPTPTVDVKMGMPLFTMIIPVRALPKSAMSATSLFLAGRTERAIERASSSSESSVVPARMKAFMYPSMTIFGNTETLISAPPSSVC